MIQQSHHRVKDLHPNRIRRDHSLGPAKIPLLDKIFHLEQYEAVTNAMRPFFRIAGIMGRGRRNAETVRLRRMVLAFEELPPSFDGMKLLFLSDMHFNGNRAVTEAIGRILDREQVDACLFGGDFSFKIFRSDREAEEQMADMLSHAKKSTAVLLGVPGNHDSWSLMASLEVLGLRLLINESVSFKRGEQRIWIAGVDDPHFFRADDFQKAMDNVPDNGFCVIVCHTPEGMRTAAEHGVNLFLCGHTHAGQIRLPVWGPVMEHSSLPGRYNSGLWCYRGMRGLTSSGVGSSGIFARFGCPPEVVRLTLRRCVPAATRHRYPAGELGSK